MIRLPLDIAACYEAMRERAAKNGDLIYQSNYGERTYTKGNYLGVRSEVRL